MQLLKAETRKEVPRRLVYYLTPIRNYPPSTPHFDSNATRRYRRGEL